MKLYGYVIVDTACREREIPDTGKSACQFLSDFALFETQDEAVANAYEAFQHDFDFYNFKDGKDEDGNSIPDKNAFEKAFLEKGSVRIQGHFDHIQYEYVEVDYNGEKYGYITVDTEGIMREMVPGCGQKALFESMLTLGKSKDAAIKSAHGEYQEDFGDFDFEGDIDEDGNKKLYFEDFAELMARRGYVDIVGPCSDTISYELIKVA